MQAEAALNGVDRKAVYLFCLARQGLLPAVGGTGVDGQGTVFVRDFGDIAAVLSVVSIEEFCGPAAEAKLQDLAWLGPRACRHEEVIEQVTLHSPVVPARFATLFSSLEELDKLVTKHRGAISQFLDQVAGKREWAVKGLLDRTKSTDQLLHEMLAKHEAETSSLTPGLRYFQQQRIRAAADKEINGWLRETCERVAADLCGHASSFSERKVVRVTAAKEDIDVVLNWAFLVPQCRSGEFRERIAQANQDLMARGLSFEVTGPWPPYSFAPSLSIE